MAKQTINIGTSANDLSGDPLRTAFDKANDNFDELYTDVAANTGTSSDFDNSYRCQINVAVTTGSNVIAFSSSFTDQNYLLDIHDQTGIISSLDAQDKDGFTVTASTSGVIHYNATYIK